MIFLVFLFVLIYGTQIFEFLKEDDLKTYTDILNQDIHKVIKRRKVEMLLMLGILYFIPSHLQKFFVLVILLVYKQPYFKIKREYTDLKEMLNLQFSIWLRMIEVLLAFHTVPVAIHHSIESAPTLMKQPLKELSKDLQDEPLNKESYLGFMSDYEELYIERSMHHLYRYAILGSDDASLQLSNMIEDNAQGLINAREKMFEDKLAFYSWFGLVPMLLVALSFLGLMFIVLTNLMKGGWHI